MTGMRVRRVDLRDVQLGRQGNEDDYEREHQLTEKRPLREGICATGRQDPRPFRPTGRLKLVWTWSLELERWQWMRVASAPR